MSRSSSLVSLVAAEVDLASLQLELRDGRTDGNGDADGGEWGSEAAALERDGDRSAESACGRIFSKAWSIKKGCAHYATK